MVFEIDGGERTHSLGAADGSAELAILILEDHLGFDLIPVGVLGGQIPLACDVGGKGG